MLRDNQMFTGQIILAISIRTALRLRFGLEQSINSTCDQPPARVEKFGISEND